MAQRGAAFIEVDQELIGEPTPWKGSLVTLPTHAAVDKDEDERAAVAHEHGHDA